MVEPSVPLKLTLNTLPAISVNKPLAPGASPEFANLDPLDDAEPVEPVVEAGLKNAFWAELSPAKLEVLYDI
jgi:hypothetical protein